MMNSHEIMMQAPLAQAKATCVHFHAGVLRQPPSSHDEPQRLERAQRSVTDSSPELSQVGWTPHPDASGMKALSRAAGDTKTGLRTEQHLLERSEQAAVIFALSPTKADYPAGHIVGLVHIRSDDL